jgi:integrase
VPRNGTNDQHLRITVVRHYAGLQSEQPDALVDHLQHYGGRAQVSIHDLSPQRRLESVETVQLHLSKAIDSVDLTFTEVPVHVVANRLGHADASVTLRVYARVLPGHRRRRRRVRKCRSEVPFRTLLLANR